MTLEVQIVPEGIADKRIEMPTPLASAHPRAEAWMRFWTYALVITSAMSIVLAELSLAMMLLGAIPLRFSHPAGWRRLGWAMAPYVGFLAVIVASALINPNRLHNLSNAIEYRILLVPLLMFVALPYLNLRRLMTVWAVVLMLVGLYGLFQHLTGLDPLYFYRPKMAMYHSVYRARGGFINPLTYCGYVLVLVAVYYSLAWNERNRGHRWYWIGGTVMGLVAMVVSLSRSGMLAVAAIGTVLLGRRHWRAALLMLTLVVALILTVAYTQKSLMVQLGRSPLARDSYLVKRFLVIRIGHDKSIEVRIHIWQAGLLGFRDKPIFGFGLYNHDPLLKPYEKIISRRYHGFSFSSVGWGSPLHNIFVRILFDLGLVGMAGFVWMWGTPIWYAIRTLRRYRERLTTFEAALLWGFCAGLAGSLAEGFFEDNFFDAEVQTIVLIVMAIITHIAFTALLRKEPLPEDE